MKDYEQTDHRSPAKAIFISVCSRPRNNDVKVDIPPLVWGDTKKGDIILKLTKIVPQERLYGFNVIVVPVQRSAFWCCCNSMVDFIDAHIGDDSWSDNNIFTFQRNASGTILVDSDYGLMTLEKAIDEEVPDLDCESFTKGLDAALKCADICYAVKSRDWDGITWDFFENESDANEHHLSELYSAATSDFNVDYIVEDVGDVISLFAKRLTLPPHLSGVGGQCVKIIAAHYNLREEIACYLLERATRPDNNENSLAS